MILITPTSPVSLHLFTYRKLPYNPVADLTPASGAASFDYALAVGPQVPANVRNVQDFIAWCKASPQVANFGSAGAGSAAHFLGSALGKAGRVDLRHIAFLAAMLRTETEFWAQMVKTVGFTPEG